MTVRVSPEDFMIMLCDDGKFVGDLIDHMCKVYGYDKEKVCEIMWDMVDAEILEYRTDATVWSLI
jgi:hypothetical protein